MPIIKKTLLLSLFFIFFSITKTLAEDLKKIGKYKDWETMVLAETSGKVCLPNPHQFYNLQKQAKEMQGSL